MLPKISKMVKVLLLGLVLKLALEIDLDILHPFNIILDHPSKVNVKIQKGLN
jgi:hypothetical protein